MTVKLFYKGYNIGRKTKKEIKTMKKRILGLVAGVMALVSVFTFTACGGFNPDKNITVVAREASSGTREAFDKVVTDGTKKLIDAELVKTANIQNKTGAVLSTVQEDKQAIGYVSLGSVDDSVKTVKVAGVEPSVETVKNHTYQIQRPFVIMTKEGVALSARAEDFVKFLRSSEMKAVCDADGVIFLENETERANAGKTAIPVGTFLKLSEIPAGDKIVIRGSTSMEKVINGAAKAYAKVYDVKPETLFDIQLEGSSKGVKAVEEDTKGNVIGLSSAAVVKDGIESFNLCLDAVAVIVNKENNIVEDLSVNQLFAIYTGEITKFSQLK